MLLDDRNSRREDDEEMTTSDVAAVLLDAKFFKFLRRGDVLRLLILRKKYFLVSFYRLIFQVFFFLVSYI